MSNPLAGISENNFAIASNACYKLPMTLIGYIRHTKSRSASRQREALEAASVETIYTEGEHGETLREAIRTLRKGDRLVVLHAWLLAEPKVKTNDRPSDTYFDAAKAIKKRGAILQELDPPRDSETACHDIAKDATRWLSGQSRGSAGAANGVRGGRPPRDWEPWREIILREWYDLRHATNADATKVLIAAGVPVKMQSDVNRAVRRLTGKASGASGRTR